MRNNFLNAPSAAGVKTPIVWCALGLLLNYHVPFLNPHLLSWNLIEINIAQNLLEGRGYVVDPLSAPAIWRPPLISLLSIPALFVTKDPAKIILVFYLASIASLTSALFYSAELLFGRVAAHVSALLALSTPAVGSVLALHVHGLSHIGFMLFVGPTIYFTIRLLRFHEKGSALATGFLLGLLCLTRPESILLVGVTALALLFSKRSSTVLFISLIAPFAAIWIPYEVLKTIAIKRYDLFPSGILANFYGSEGWIRGSQISTSDREGGGWLAAINKYSAPNANNFSLVTAISNNYTAFLERLVANLGTFRSYFFGNELFHIYLAPFLIFLPFSRSRLSECIYLLLCSLVPLFFIFFHISDRYLTPLYPFFLLLSAGGLQGFICYLEKHVTPFFLRSTCTIPPFLILFFPIISLYQLVPLWNLQNKLPAKLERNEEILAEQFLAHHKETPVVLDVPRVGAEPKKLSVLLLSYYAKTAINWSFQTSIADYPRDKIFSASPKHVDYYYADDSILSETNFLLHRFSEVSPSVVITPEKTFYLFSQSKDQDARISPLRELTDSQSRELEQILSAKRPHLLKAFKAKMNLASIETAIKKAGFWPAVILDRVACAPLGFYSDSKPDQVIRLDTTDLPYPDIGMNLRDVQLLRESPVGFYGANDKNYPIAAVDLNTGQLLNDVKNGALISSLNQGDIALLTCDDGATKGKSQFRLRLNVDGTWIESQKFSKPEAPE